MSIEGRLTIVLRRDRTGPSRAHIASSRPTKLARLFAGRTVDEVTRDLPMLFSVCGIAQASASLSACAQALGVVEADSASLSRQLLVHAETLREHLLRITHDHFDREGEAPGQRDLTAIMRLVPDLRAALCEGHNPFVIGADPPVDTDRVLKQVSAVESLLQGLVFGEAPHHWSERMTPAALEQWTTDTDTIAAGLVDYVLHQSWAGVGAGETKYLPDLPAASLFEHLTGAEGEIFAARPEWQGEVFESTALSRQKQQPLVAALLATHGSGLLTRLAARLVEVARLPELMRDLARQTAGEESVKMSGGESVGDGRGLAQIEAARGRLIHGVAVADGRVTDYRILAPTEWNFHPEGGLARALAKLEGTDEHSLRSQAELLIETVDPCVGYHLVVH